MRAEAAKGPSLMRRDMPKLLCERERIGSKNGKPSRRNRRRSQNNKARKDWESAPKGEPMSGGFQHGYDRKQLNENLNPLYKFLRARVGKHWDKVYAELRKNLRLDDPVQLHIMQHLWQYVDRDIKVSDQGPLVEIDLYGWRRDKNGVEFTVNGKRGWRRYVGYYNSRRDEMFIHPKSGCLALAPKPKKTQDRPAVWTRFWVGKEFYAKTDGIWYRWPVVPLPDGWEWGKPRVTIVPARTRLDGTVVPEHNSYDYGPRDTHFGNIGMVDRGNRRPFGRSRRRIHDVQEFYSSLDVYCPDRPRQLSRSELRRLKIKNDPPVVKQA